MNVLICTQQGEQQIESVCENLRRMGANPVIFERYRNDQFMAYHYGKTTSAVFRTEDNEYPLNSKTFPVVWYRPKPVILSEIPGEIGRIEEKFCMQEWRVILQSLEIFLSSSHWVNSISASLKAANKTYQLKLALEIGLQIPQTTITNDAAQALKLFQDNRVIYKTLSGFYSMKQAIYTNEITYEQVLKNKEAIAMAPGIFQKCIEKSHELRITVVREKIFIVKINSQLQIDSSIDWRRSPKPEHQEFGELSEKTKRKLLMMHKTLGLIYAAYDFIVDTEGNEIFIECNPSGQWLWLENDLELGISKAMADTFLSMKDIK